MSQQSITVGYGIVDGEMMVALASTSKETFTFITPDLARLVATDLLIWANRLDPTDSNKEKLND